MQSDLIITFRSENPHCLLNNKNIHIICIKKLDFIVQNINTVPKHSLSQCFFVNEPVFANIPRNIYFFHIQNFKKAVFVHELNTKSAPQKSEQ